MDEALKNILALVNVAGEIEGRTKFQKMVYILQCKGVPFSERFRYHYYGPYSIDLQLEIDELVDRELLNDKHDPDLAPTHAYFTTENTPNEPEITGKLSAHKDLIHLLNKADRRILELTSTIYFLRNQEKITDKTVIEKKLDFLKPHLKQYVNQAFQLEQQIDSNKF